MKKVSVSAFFWKTIKLFRIFFTFKAFWRYLGVELEF